jgi:predicted dehydrogenase
LQIEVNGAKASLRWVQERPDEMWLGYRDKANAQLLRDANLLDDSVKPYVNLPGGHSEGWADAFKNLMSSIYSFIAEERDMTKDADKIAFPTFEDGYRVNCVVDAIVRSNQNRSVWTDVEY